MNSDRILAVLVGSLIGYLVAFSILGLTSWLGVVPVFCLVIGFGLGVIVTLVIHP